MFAIDVPTAAVSLPAPAAPGSTGYFTKGDPSHGPPIPATILDQDFMNMTMVELLNVVVAGGLTPSKTTYTQLRDAILALINAGNLAPFLNHTAAATCDLGAAVSGSVSPNANVTGNTGITSFGSSASTNYPLYFVTFAGTPTLTHNAVSLILPGAANITVAAGDALIAKYLGSGNWQVLAYFAADASPSLRARGWAWCTTSGAGGNVTQQAKGSMGTFSISRAGAGDYTLSWANALDVNFAIFTNGPVVEIFADRTSTSVHLRVYDVTNGLSADGPQFTIEFKHV